MPRGEPGERRRRLRVLPRSGKGWTRLGAAVATGVLLGVAYPPYDLGLLALVALVPLLWTWHDKGPGRSAAAGFVAGLVFFGITLGWTRNVGLVAAIALVIAQACFWAAGGAIVGALGRLGVRAPWITAAVWVLLEAARGRWPLGGMAWAEAGMALHDQSAARALASFGGVPLVSFLVVACNALLLDAVLAVVRARRGRGAPDPAPRSGSGSGSGARWGRALGLAGGGLVLVVVVTVAAVQLRFEPTPTGHLKFALVQGNDQDRRLTQSEIDGNYLTDKHLALAGRLRGDYDLIVFPESAFETDPEADSLLRYRLVQLAKQHHASVLANAITHRAGDRGYNTNRLYEPDGHLQASYDKQHLVPFGEYVPWGGWPRELIPALAAQVPDDLTPGDRTVVFDVGGHRVGSVICFESAFSPLVRSSVRDGAEAIVVTTNNRSYRRSALSAQHLATSQMRAAETGRPVLHAAVSGITGVVDASGRVVETNPLFHNALVTGEVTTMTGETPYVRYGDWAVWGSLLVVAGAVIAGLTRRRLLRRG